MIKATIDWGSKVSLADQLRCIIKRRYIDGRAAGARVPTEFQLAAEFGVNRTVARRAVELLRNEGFVLRRPRHGTFIAANARKELAVAYYEEKRYSFSALLDRFEKACPAVRIKRIAAPVNGYDEVTARMLEEGVLDLLRISARLFNGYRPAAQFLSLNKFYRNNGRATRAAPWAAFRFNKTRYGLPLAYGPTVMACNRDMFRAAGVEFPRDDWTLEQFEGTAAKLTRQSAGASMPEQYGFLCPNLLDRWMMFVYNHGGRLWDAASGEFAITNPAGMAGLSVLRRMVQNRVCAPLHGASDPYRLFVRGKAAMTLASYHAISSLRASIAFDWGLAAFPVCQSPASLLIVDGIAVAKNTANLDAVFAFLKFCLSDNAQQYIAGEGNAVSVRSDMPPPACAQTPFNYGLYQNIHARSMFPELPFHDPRSQVVADETALYVNGMQSAGEYCSNLAAYAAKNKDK